MISLQSTSVVALICAPYCLGSHLVCARTGEKVGGFGLSNKQSLFSKPRSRRSPCRQPRGRDCMVTASFDVVYCWSLFHCGAKDSNVPVINMFWTLSASSIFVGWWIRDDNWPVEVYLTLHTKNCGLSVLVPKAQLKLASVTSPPKMMDRSFALYFYKANHNLVLCDNVRKLDVKRTCH